MTDITFKGVPEGIVERVKSVALQLTAQEIQRTELQPTTDQVDAAKAKLEEYKTANGIIEEPKQ